MTTRPPITAAAFLLVAVATLALWNAALAEQRPVPPMPNSCAETACAAIRSSAELVCSEATWDADGCDIALADLEKCFETCAGGE